MCSWFTWREENTDWRRVPGGRNEPPRHQAKKRKVSGGDGSGGRNAAAKPNLHEKALENIRSRGRSIRARGGPNARSPSGGKAVADDEPWNLVGGGGVDEHSLSQIRKDAAARKLAERKRPRALAALADYFENGVKGIP